MQLKVKLRLNVTKTYQSKILELRMTTYPQLYFILSNLAKKIRDLTFSNEILNKALKDIEDWDSKYAICMSAATTSICFDFRIYLEIFLEEIKNKEILQKTYLDLLDEIGIFEYSLKNDLGIWGIKGDKIYEMKEIASRKDFLEESKKLRKNDSLIES